MENIHILEERVKTMVGRKRIIILVNFAFVAFFSFLVTPSYGIEKDELWRFDSDRPFEVAVVFLNPLLKDPGNTLQFELNIKTHTENLDKFYPEEHAYLQIGDGMLHKSIIWINQERDSHYINGILKFIGPIPPSSKKIQLFLHDLGDVNKRTFKWLLPISSY